MAKIAKLGEKIRGARLRWWYRHVKRREVEYVGRRTLEMEVPGRRKRGRPRKWLDVVREDMESVGVVEEDVVNRGVWRKKMRCGDPK